MTRAARWFHAAIVTVSRRRLRRARPLLPPCVACGAARQCRSAVGDAQRTSGMAVPTPSTVGRMTSSLLAVIYQVKDPARVARFWASLLGRETVTKDGVALLLGDATQVGMGFASCSTEKTGPNHVHLHLTSTSEADQQRTLETALELGARHLDVGQHPEEGHVVLADPGNNEFCVIEPDNSFLAGCGFIGELACDGRREVGLFWSKALGWPLVWDHEEETAIQSPLGGTKIAWSGSSGTPRGTTTRQWFELTCTPDDARSEFDRLISLGATRVDDNTLADPDGPEFRLVMIGH